MAWQAFAIGFALLALGSFPATAGPLPRYMAIGQGDAVAYNGTWSCTDQKFYIEATQVTANRALVSFHWASAAPPCGLHNGGGTPIGTVFYDTRAVPPVWFDFACKGTLQAGLDCGYIRVGAIGAAGGRTVVDFAGTSHSFTGLFDPL